MGSWRKRGKNSWQLVLEKGRDAMGNRTQPTKTIRITDPAILRAPKRLEEYLRDQVAKFKMEYETGIDSSEARLSFVQLKDVWIKKYVEINLEEKTKENYLYHMNRRIIPYFERMWLDDITTRHITNYLVHLRSPEARIRGNGTLKSASIVYNYRILKSLFKFAVNEKYIAAESNPMIGVEKPKEDDVKEMEIYDEQEIAQLVEALEGESLLLRILILFALITGMRRGELVGLEWPNIDLDSGIVQVKQSIPKTLNGVPVIKGPKNKNSVRRISLPESFIAELKAFRAQQLEEQQHFDGTWEGRQFVFAHPDGMPVHPQRLGKWWLAFHRRHGLKHLRFHDLRHTSVSWMIFKRIHSEVIAKRTGHKNTKMLQIYGHIYKTVEQETAAVFDGMLMSNKKVIKSEVDHELITNGSPNSQNSSNEPQNIH